MAVFPDGHLPRQKPILSALPEIIQSGKTTLLVPPGDEI
jgi:hypothetical protein